MLWFGKWLWRYSFATPRINLISTFPFTFVPFSDTRTFQASQALHPYPTVDRRSRGMDRFTENRKCDGLVGQACDICAWVWVSHDGCVSYTAEILMDVANREHSEGLDDLQPHPTRAPLYYTAYYCVVIAVNFISWRSFDIAFRHAISYASITHSIHRVIKVDTILVDVSSGNGRTREQRDYYT